MINKKYHTILILFIHTLLMFHSISIFIEVHLIHLNCMFILYQKILFDDLFNYIN